MVGKPEGGLRLRSLQLDFCPHLGRSAAEALAVRPGLLRCSLSSCRPMPQAAQAWEDSKSRDEACKALGVSPPLDLGDDDLTPSNQDNVARQLPTTEAEEIPQCAICMDDITAEDAFWRCPVCCNKLHDIEDCARGWLRLRQSCPTCRAAAWAPPPEESRSSSSNPFRPFQVSNSTSSASSSSVQRRRPARALSAEPLSGRGSSGSGLTPTGASRLAAPVLDISVSGMNVRGSSQNVVSASPTSSSPDLSVLPGRPPLGISGTSQSSRRPPRPSASSSASTASTVSTAGGRLAAALAAAPAALSGAPRSRSQPPNRSRSQPQGPGALGGAFALAGLSIVGNARSVS
eukprot:TRINITY_DN110309_c0_g1_i1.p1 TRINITY_DN110309_c0_g1~~TRINITY_DN110309_c0_g1_i1.p1  ORF type:complete len:396 (+),score=51.59 TRINITY_DN110309_c0_g1_i1:152-1189(+)